VFQISHLLTGSALHCHFFFFPLVSGKWIFHVGVLDVQLKFKLAEEVSFQVR